MSVVQVGKTDDFAPACTDGTADRASPWRSPLLNIRQSERTTAEEVRPHTRTRTATGRNVQHLLTVEFCEAKPGSDLDGHDAQWTASHDSKGLCPATDRGRCERTWTWSRLRESHRTYLKTIAQTLGPEALMKYIDASEAIKRLAAAQGIDVLNHGQTWNNRFEMQQQMGMANQKRCRPSRSPCWRSNDGPQ